MPTSMKMSLMTGGGPRTPWRELESMAMKNGQHPTVYAPFTGDKYIGEYRDNKRAGKGRYVGNEKVVPDKDMAIAEPETDTRRIPQSKQVVKYVYDGDWHNDKRHGFGTLSVFNKKTNKLTKSYAGGWKQGMRHGFGTHFYDDGQYYEGEYKKNKRCGWGVMYYSDGSRYEGDWDNDERNGAGVLILANGSMYEGMWKNDLKNGEGCFHYLDKKQRFEGVYVDGIPKCGTFVDTNGRVPNEMDEVESEASFDSAEEDKEFKLPPLGLKDADQVLNDTKEALSRVALF